ncbi:tryptophan--tRNA ligase, partial [Candidatus Micrarchaeota archaeon]|nr:tryptophan--tRNA ligase [Candidatus Micrarchaeota archaeon]
ITLNTLEAVYGHQNLGLYTAALIQAGDILQPQLEEFGGPKHILVPVGVDQDPHIRLTRDIAAKFQEEHGFILPSATYHRFFRALNGETKMSKRDPMSVLTLNDSPELAEKKVKNIFTGGRATAEEQRKLGAETWKCVWFELMKFHFLEDDDLQTMYDDSLKGRILCGECKAKYLERLQGFLETHQERKKKMRAKAEKLLEACVGEAPSARAKARKKL